MAKKKEKTKEIKLQMEFNPGTEKYEPILPLRKTKENLRIGVDWKFIIIIGILLILLILAAIFFSEQISNAIDLNTSPINWSNKNG